jgi:two-component system chemotaxis sensor kinase CheA
MTETGMELDNMKEIVDEFMIEADEILAKLDEDMVKLEKNSADLNLLNEIFRAAHTIKGTSGFLGLDKVSELTHKMEDVLNKLRKGELKTNPVIMDALLQAIDTLKLLLEDLRTGKDSGIDLAFVKGQLIAASSVTAGVEAPATKKEAKKNGKSQKIDISATATPTTPIESSIPKTESPVAQVTPLPAEIPELSLVEAEPVEEEKEATDEMLRSDGGASLVKQMAEMRRGADQTIRVDVGRLDSLMNIMGELVLGRNAMIQLTNRITSRYEGQE